jgi:hypothetical protein
MPARLATRMGLVFAAISAACIAGTLLFTLAGIAISLEARVSRDLARAGAMAEHLFTAQCELIHEHLSAIAGHAATRIVAAYTPERASEYLRSIFPTSHADGLLLISSTGQGVAHVLGEAHGRAQLPGYNDLPILIENPGHAQLIRLENSETGASLAMAVPVKSPSEAFWLLALVAIEVRIAEHLGGALGLAARWEREWKPAPVGDFYRALLAGGHAQYSAPLKGCRGENFGAMSLRMTLAEPRAALLRQAGYTILAGLAWITAATLAGVWLARKTAASLVKIREAARAVMLLPNAPRIDMKGYPVEFAELAATFNSMAARVEAATLERERLLSAAAEQLNAGTAALRRLNGRCPYA